MERVRNSGNLSTMDIVCCGLFAAMIAIGAFIKIMIPVGAFEVTFYLQFLFASSDVWVFDRLCCCSLSGRIDFRKVFKKGLFTFSSGHFCGRNGLLCLWLDLLFYYV